MSTLRDELTGEFHADLPPEVAEPMRVAILQALDSKAKLFKAFAEPIRLSILEQLRSGERSRPALAAAVGCSELRLTNYVDCLRSFGLIWERQEDGELYYTLASDEVRQVLDLGDDLLAVHSEQVYRCPRI